MRKNFVPGQQATLTKKITDEIVQQFAMLTSDTNPLHLDDAFAKTTRFGWRNWK